MILSRSEVLRMRASNIVNLPSLPSRLEPEMVLAASRAGYCHRSISGSRHRPRISAYGGAVHACFGLRCKTDGYDSDRSFHGSRFYGMIQINDTGWPRAQSIITRILASKKEREAIGHAT